MKLYATFFVIVILFLSQEARAQDQVVVIGSGGGFSGAVTAYKITSKGEVLKGSGVVEIKYTECAKIKKSTAKKIIDNTSREALLVKEFNHPGNMYSFLSIENGKEQTRLTWGDNNTPAPEKIRQLHADILKTVGSLRYKPIKK